MADWELEASAPDVAPEVRGVGVLLRDGDSVRLDVWVAVLLLDRRRGPDGLGPELYALVLDRFERVVVRGELRADFGDGTVAVLPVVLHLLDGERDVEVVRLVDRGVDLSRGDLRVDLRPAVQLGEDDVVVAVFGIDEPLPVPSPEVMFEE
jgi:hypothetical protein